MIKFLIKKHTAVFTATLLILILGVTAYISLPRESSPEIKQPWIFVTTVYPGVGARDIESLVTQPIEEEIDGLEGITELSSTSKLNVSSIFVEFSSDIDVETALRKVKERVDVARTSLPDDVDDPNVQELTSSDWPIFIVMLSHPGGIQEIDSAALELQERIKRVNGVLDVEIAGNLEKEIAIELDPMKLQHYDLSLDDVAYAIQSENTNIPGGLLRNESKNYSLSVTGEIKEPEEFRDIIIQSGDLRVRLKDLGDTAFQYAAAESISRLNGVPAISLEIKKRTGENIIDLVKTVKEEIVMAEDTFPAGTTFTYSYDESKFITDVIFDLENNMFTAFILVLAVTLFFLGRRNSLFVSLAIPLSMLMSFVILQLLGVTLNMIVLFSLILALGMLVDNGIVIVENIFRHTAMGKSRIRASIDGTKEVSGPIIASTLTTCLAFFPIIFMPGIMGDFMAYVPITVIVVLGSSLFVALIINPVFCARFLNISDKAKKKMIDGTGVFFRFQNLYEKILKKALRRPGIIALVSLVIVLSGFGMYGLIGKEPIFFPNLDPSTAIIELETRLGTPLDETDRFTRRIEEIIPTVPSSLEHYQVVTGGGGDDSHKATIRVEYKPYLERKISGADATGNLKQELDGFTGAEVNFEELDMGPPSGHPVSYEVVGRDYLILGDLSRQVLAILRDYPELKLINTDYEASKPEVSIEIDRKKAAYFGLSTVDIARTVRNSMNGTSVGKFRLADEEYDINVRYQDEYRDSLTHLRNLQVVNGDGDRVPVQSVAEIRYISSVGVIKRRNHQRSVGVWADFKEGVQNKTEVKTEIGKRIDAIAMPAGYFAETGEGVEVQQESSQFLIKAYGIALFLMLLVLIVQFNTFTDPIIILLSVFLSMGGVLWGYALSGQVFVIVMSGIGCIALAGVAVNNCIVLVDYTNVLIRSGIPWNEAIVQAGKTRLRPVLLTAITTVLGLVPMALGVSLNIHAFAIQLGSEQSEFWKAFAWAMIYGLSFATIMTLIVVPSLLTLKYRFIDKRKGKKSSRWGDEQKELQEEEKDVLVPAMN